MLFHTPKIIRKTAKNRRLKSKAIKQKTDHCLANQNVNGMMKLGVNQAADKKTFNYQREAPQFVNFKVMIKNFDPQTLDIQKFNVVVRPPHLVCKATKEEISCEFNDQTYQSSHLQFTQNNVQYPIRQAYENPNTSFRMFLLNRHKNTLDTKVDLSYCNLSELIKHCLDQNIINQQMYERFCLYHNKSSQMSFIEQYEQGKLQINLKFQLFAEIDHRLLCQILCSNNPSKFKQSLQYPITFNQLTNIFLKKLYQMPYKKYIRKIQEFNKSYERFWINAVNEDIQFLNFNVLINNNEQFHRITKHGRLMRQRI